MHPEIPNHPRFTVQAPITPAGSQSNFPTPRRWPQKPTKPQETMALFFKALAHKRRMMICDILLPNGAVGLSLEKLQAHTGLAASTLGHHLSQMERGGLIKRQNKGKEAWIALDHATLNATLSLFANGIRQGRVY